MNSPSPERFIPIARQEIVKHLLARTETWQNVREAQQFKEFCDLLTAFYHFKFLANLEQLKGSYFPFDPDTDLISLHNYEEPEKEELHQQLQTAVKSILTSANYIPMTLEELQRNFAAASYYGVNVSVDLDDFADLLIYYRGSTTRTEQVRNWKTLFFTYKTVEVPIYKRLFIMLKIKKWEDRVQEVVAELNREHPNWSREKMVKKAENRVQRARQDLPEKVGGQIFFKSFKNIPCSDLEMIFPNPEIRLKLFDKIKLTITGGGGTVGGVLGIFFKVSTAVFNPLALIGAFVGFVGVIIRQIMAIFNHRTKYMMVLSRNLYFHNLSNNLGALSGLLDEAEEEEGKEAILAYYFLHTQSAQGSTKDSLDKAVESYLREFYGVTLDFEIDDGLRKLREQEILTEAEGILSVLSPERACEHLDRQWDELFKYHQSLEEQMLGELVGHS